MQHTYIRTYMRTCVRYVAFKIEVGRAGGSGGRGGAGGNLGHVQPIMVSGFQCAPELSQQSRR